MIIRPSLLLGATLVPFAVPVSAQQLAPTAAAGAAQQGADSSTQPSADLGDDEAIVVTGARARGSALGDIPPENTLDARDVRATGATNVSELLDALAPQIGSAQSRGGERPVLLLNGQRISGFRELRDVPTEAIERVEILPEEVALKYGYRADQKVVNIVLRQRFRSTAATIAANAATDGGYFGGNGDVTRLSIGKKGRTTFNLHAQGNGMLAEAERNILIDLPPATASTDQVLGARSLLGSKRQLRGSATINRSILGNVSATLNGEVEHDDGRSLIGLGETLLLPLDRNTTTDSAHLGTTLNWDKAQWHWNVTGNADLERDTTGSARDSSDFPLDRGRETRASGDLTATANGKMFKLPAGDASATVTLGASTTHLDSERLRLGQSTRTSLGRTSGQVGVNIDLPISRGNRDFGALGNLTLNGNAEIDRLTDFGTITTLGAGANWSPVDRLSIVASWTLEEGAPSVQQLGDPVLETPGTRIFDFTTGQTVLATTITGGNPDLKSDRRKVVKLGAHWQPFPNADLRLRADFVYSNIDRPIQGIFGPSAALEAAFPDRFVRDSSGQLVSADLRPINFDNARKDTLRIGLDFSKPLKSRRPSQSVIDQIRAQFRAAGGGGRGGAQRGNATAPTVTTTQAPSTNTPASPQAAPTTGAPPAPPPGGASLPPGSGDREGAGGASRRGGGGGGGFFGGGSRGRLQFSLTDTITFVDRVSIGPGMPELDYLHGEASGASGGTPRHVVQAQAGWSNNGLGARLGANLRSGTTVNSLTGDDLRFSPLATFDLRLFDNLGDQPGMVLKHPWLRGTQLRLEVTNLLNSRPKVRDASGAVPLSYQPDLLDPLGRTVMISFRKLFSPSPSAMRRLREQEQQSTAPPPPPSPTPPTPTR